ncbi:hypothetical protein K8I61_15810, partial [bacterium]|nr:hypothetical protein [bacterium]
MTHAAAPFADPAPRPLARVHLAFLFVQLVFGGFHVVGKLVMGSVEPLALAGIRVIFAVPILGLAAWTIERYRPTRADLWAFAKLGLFGVFLNQV